MKSLQFLKYDGNGSKDRFDYFGLRERFSRSRIAKKAIIAGICAMLGISGAISYKHRDLLVDLTKSVANYSGVNFLGDNKAVDNSLGWVDFSFDKDYERDDDLSNMNFVKEPYFTALNESWIYGEDKSNRETTEKGPYRVKLIRGTYRDLRSDSGGDFDGNPVMKNFYRGLERRLGNLDSCFELTIFLKPSQKNGPFAVMVDGFYFIDDENREEFFKTLSYSKRLFEKRKDPAAFDNPAEKFPKINIYGMLYEERHNPFVITKIILNSGQEIKLRKISPK